MGEDRERSRSDLELRRTHVEALRSEARIRTRHNPKRIPMSLLAEKGR